MEGHTHISCPNIPCLELIEQSCPATSRAPLWLLHWGGHGVRSCPRKHPSGGGCAGMLHGCPSIWAAWKPLSTPPTRQTTQSAGGKCSGCSFATSVSGQWQSTRSVPPSRADHAVPSSHGASIAHTPLSRSYNRSNGDSAIRMCPQPCMRSDIMIQCGVMMSCVPLTWNTLDMCLIECQPWDLSHIK